MKGIIILGSTGSIGRNALEIISRHPDRFRVVGLGAGSNIELLDKQIRRFKPVAVAVYDTSRAELLKKRLKGWRGITVLSGEKGLKEIVSIGEADFVLSAISGSAGLIPTISAIRNSKTVGLANKETLVVAGEIVMRDAERYSSKIIPVDSEHSAIFQCIENKDKGEIKRLILTASGGPFRGKKYSELRNVSVEEALKHPRWKMGKKITIDSATLMNKGLEVIEAHHLFGIPPERIDVIIHPQSIVHSMVEFCDGSLLAQMSNPDMKAPIAYALTYPERLSDVIHPLKLDRVKTLTFERVDKNTFPSLGLAYRALKEGGTMPAVLNTANEVAVEAFLMRRIPFSRIPYVIKKVMDLHRNNKAISDIDTVLEVQRWARERAESIIRRIG